METLLNVLRVILEQAENHFDKGEMGAGLADAIFDLRQTIEEFEKYGKSY